MQWTKSVRYQSSLKVGRYTYSIVCQSDDNGGYLIFLNDEFVADTDKLPTEDEVRSIVKDYIDMETTIKGGFAASGVFQ